MGEVFFIIALIGGLIGWTFLLNGKARVLWLITMGSVGAIVGTMEIVSKIMYGMTISQFFWAWSVQNVVLAYTAMSMLLAGIGVLIIHLMWKVWTNREYKKEPK